MQRKEILVLDGKYVQENNIKTRFKNGIPRKDWFIGNCKRYGISCKKKHTSKRQRVRTESTTSDIIYGFFDL